MSKLIDADALILEGTISDIIEEIIAAPTVDALPVVRGKWVKPAYLDGVRCENCGERSYKATPYCPSCGAKMEGEE